MCTVDDNPGINDAYFMIMPSLNTVHVIVEGIAANSMDCSNIYSLHHDGFEFLATD